MDSSGRMPIQVPRAGAILFMKDYFFKYIVPDHSLREFSRFRPALRYAKKLNEKVYLTTFSKSNTYSEPYDEEIVSAVPDIAPAKKKLIASFYKVTGTQPMTRKDYRIAYKFLRMRVTRQGCIAPFEATINLPEAQCNRIYKFLQYNHQVKFI
jgi:hypothetical protein